MIYRDQHERCPVCGVELTDAGAVRACTGCNGMWVSPETLAEMARAMQSPSVPITITCTLDERQALPCPTCTEPMGTWRLLMVPIDRCEKHGLWFDRDELQRVLYAIFDPEDDFFA